MKLFFKPALKRFSKQLASISKSGCKDKTSFCKHQMFCQIISNEVLKRFSKQSPLSLKAGVKIGRFYIAAKHFSDYYM